MAGLQFIYFLFAMKRNLSEANAAFCHRGISFIKRP